MTCTHRICSRGTSLSSGERSIHAQWGSVTEDILGARLQLLRAKDMTESLKSTVNCHSTYLNKVQSYAGFIGIGNDKGGQYVRKEGPGARIKAGMLFSLEKNWYATLQWGKGQRSL